MYKNQLIKFSLFLAKDSSFSTMKQKVDRFIKETHCPVDTTVSLFKRAIIFRRRYKRCPNILFIRKLRLKRAWKSRLEIAIKSLDSGLSTHRQAIITYKANYKH